MRLPKGATAAEAIGWLAVNLVPVRTDLTGRLTGWYRLHHDGKPVPPDARLSELDPSLPLVVHTIPNEVRMADITVAGSSEVRFLAPVGTAVPVVSLVDHLTGWLELPVGAYSLHTEAGPLPPHAVLADLPASTGKIKLTLRSDNPEGAE